MRKAKFPFILLAILVTSLLTATSAPGEDGGVVPSEGRERVNAYFKKLKATKTAEEEKELLTEFAEWLIENDYKIEVEKLESSHRIACPYFPPVTPWMDYRFRDIENLKLLPLLQKE